MKYFLFGLLTALTSIPAQADLAFVQGSDFVVLHEQSSCNVQLTELARTHGIPPDVPLFAADAMVNGKHFSACWADGGPAVGLIYEDGDTGIIPKQFLKKLKDA